MLLALFVLWLAANEPGVPADHYLWIAGASAAFCTGLAARFGGIGRQFTALPASLVVFVAQSAGVVSAAFKTVRAGLSAEISVRPVLIRVKSKIAEGESGAAFANLISAHPGMAVVETDADGLLVHVLDEAAADGAAFAHFEARARRLAGAP
jgi:multisubunit Na+/H+ antiporter MnhE subunit